MSWCVFFFQAEDGIRDYKVTGVQTCALPISGNLTATGGLGQATLNWTAATDNTGIGGRSEERRVGKEGRSQRTPYKGRKKREKMEKSKRRKTRGKAMLV